MPEENKTTQETNSSWHFWFLVSFSLFLVVTFALYLPLRFEHKILFQEDGKRMEEHMPGEEQMMNEMDDGAHNRGPSVYHEEGQVKEGLSVNFNITPVPAFINASVQLDFFVNQKPGNIPVLVEKLEIENTKLMHVIGIRSDMNEFFHIHPQPSFTEGILSINYFFNQPGLYKVWSEIKKDGTVHSFGHPEISISGEGAREEKQVSFGRNIIIGDYQVLLKTDDTIVRGRESKLSFDIHTLTNMKVDIEEYLGVPMHLTVIKDDWKQFIHTHPEESVDQHSKGIINQVGAHSDEKTEPEMSSDDELINFHITFPEAGLYKIFGQFRPRGINLPADEALTAYFWVRVDEKAPVGAYVRWLLLAVSAIMIVILSWTVSKFLKVKVEVKNH